VSLSPKQVEFRKTGIGGSESAAILGIHPYLSAMELFARKVGLMDSSADSVRLRVGSALEPTVVDEYQRKTGLSVVRRAEACEMLRHPEHHEALANLDGIGEAKISGKWQDVIFEAKTVGSRAWWLSWDNGKQVPLYIQCQVQHYMWVTGYQAAELAALVDMSALHVFPIARDDDFINNKLAPAVLSFWRDNVQAKVPPIWDGSTSCYDALKTMHPPKDAEGAIELPGLLDTMLEYQALGEQESVIKGRRKEIKNEALAKLGDAREADLGGGLLLKRTKANALQVKEIKA